MKKKLFENEQEGKENEKNKWQNRSQNDSLNHEEEENRNKAKDDKFQLSKSEGLIGSISTLRNGINK